MEPDKLNLESLNIPEHKKQLLKQAFPEVFGEGDKIDFEKLKAALGEQVEQPGRERFGLSWAGKSKLFQLIQEPSRGTLRPAKEESVDWDTTENVFIEGDNLEVLKLLQKSYLGKIKMIYIDPPYNTGGDFVYPDDYSESLDTYLEYTGQKIAGGKSFGLNQDTDGRFHSKWLSMLYPRLFLARNLLDENGIVLISIDDNEVSSLRKICDEIFGTINYKGTIVRATGQTTGQDSGGLGLSFDYIVIYSKSDESELAGLPLSEDDLERYEEEDEKGKYALWQLRKTGSNDRRIDRPNMYFPVKDPDGKDVYPIGPTGYESRWRFDENGYMRLKNANYIVWKKRDKNGKQEWWPYVKTYLEGRTKRPSPLWTDIEGSKKASIDLKSLMGAKVFDNPKPVQMVKRVSLIAPEPNKEIYVLDFFAGSCTTAHAVLDLNQEDGGNRKFIMVQLPEPCAEDSEAFKAGYKTIADIGKERIRRVIKKIKDEKKGKLDLEETKQDLGFRIYKLDTSNFKQWQAKTADGTPAVQKEVELFVDPFIPARNEEDILAEILLKSGFELSAKIEEIKIAKKKVYSIAEGALYICLEDDLTEEFIKAAASKEPHQFVCLDKAFHEKDDLKANALLTFKARQNADGTPKTIFKTV